MLKEHKSDFNQGKIDKYKFMNSMQKSHSKLYEYADFIKGSNIVNIEIKDGEVYFTYIYNGYNLTMVSLPYDEASIAFTLLNFGSYESKEDEVLFDLIKDCEVALDIGANTGWYTLNWLKRYKDLKVFSFEVMPLLYDKLIQNLILNGFGIKNTFNIGLSNFDKKKEFYFDKERCGASSMVNLRGTNNTQKIKCRVKKLDTIFPSLGVDQLDFIKCDVEGAEKLVFEGGLNTLKKYRPIVFTEMLRKWSKKIGYHPNDIIQFFKKIGYSCFIIKDSNLIEFFEVNEDTLETNYFFIDKKIHKL